MNRNKVKQLAESIGCTLSKPERFMNHKEVTCDAPDGYMFIPDGVTQFVSSYYPEFGESAKDAYQDIWDRLSTSKIEESTEY